MTRAVAQTPSDLVLSSTTESQEAIEHAVSDNWKDPFIPAAEKKAADEAARKAAEATLAETETAEQKAERERVEAEAEHVEETPEQKAQRIADEAEPVKGNWSKRVNKLTARNARIAEELRIEREARAKLEARLSALERGEKQPTDDSSTPNVADLPGKPKRIDFQDEGQYLEKMIDWTKRNEDYKEGMQEEQERVKQVLDAHAVRIEEARDRYDDWDQIAKSAEKLFLPIAVDFAIREMNNSADVLYFLAKNPKEFERMNKLTNNQQIIEAGRISDKLTARAGANGNGTTRRQRNAPPEPITPGGRRTAAHGTKLEDIAEKQGVDGTEEYIRARRAMRIARRAN